MPSSSMTVRDVTVIVAAAGPVPVPSWTLPLADGRPALASVVESLNCTHVSRLVFVCLRQHLQQFCSNQQDLVRMIESVNGELTGRVEVLPLDNPTKSGVDTIVAAIKSSKIEGGLFIKDADGAFDFDIPSASSASGGSYCVCLTVDDNNITSLSELTRKSFVQQCGGILSNIVEKKIISDTICVGGYSFESAADYVAHAEKLESGVPASFFDASSRKQGVLFHSDIILSLLAHQHVISVKFVKNFCDWKSASGVAKFKQAHQNIVISFEEELCSRNKTFAFHMIELIAGNCNTNKEADDRRKLQVMEELFSINESKRKQLEEKKTLNGGRFVKVCILTSLPKRIEYIVAEFLKKHKVPFDAIVCDMFSEAGVKL